MKIILAPAEVSAIVAQAMSQALTDYALRLGLPAENLTVSVGEDGSAEIDTAAPLASGAVVPVTATPSATAGNTGTRRRQAPVTTAKTEPAPVVNGDTQLKTPAAEPEPDPTPPPSNVKPLFAKAAPAAETPPSDPEMQARIDAEIADMTKAKMVAADQITPEPEPADENDTPEPAADQAPPPPPPARKSLFADLRKPNNG